MTNSGKLEALEKYLQELYKEHNDRLLFHGWHHIVFVRNKSLIFAEELNSDKFLVESSALVHDLNYVVECGTNVEAGNYLRNEILLKCEYTTKEIEQIQKIVSEEDLFNRMNNQDKDISNEAKALSDADSLFKVLPITPIVFSAKYLLENNKDIRQLAYKIVTEQSDLVDSNKYFYSKKANDLYMKWAKMNLSLWNEIRESLEDEDIKLMLKLANVPNYQNN